MARGHQVTLFNRGKTQSGPADGTRQVTGDREHDLALLEGHRWDAVVDTCGYVPRIVGLSCDALSGSCDQYLFVSSISVYRDADAEALNEADDVLKLSDPTTEEINAETYGGLKAMCEERVRKTFAERATVLRPGLVVGPYDYTDRFTHWAQRFSAAAKFVVPDLTDSPVQWIDARDLGEFCVTLLESRKGGTFNVAGPSPAMGFREFVEKGTAGFGNVATPVWIDPKILEGEGLGPWMDFPLLPSFDGSGCGYLRADNSAALESGLTLRALEETLADTAAWCGDKKLAAGVAVEREKEIIARKRASRP